MSPNLARLTRLLSNLPNEPDDSLISAFLGGNQAAFRELVDRHGSLVYGVCNRILRHQQDAEDAFQAVFIVLAREAADVWPRDAVGSWLYGVATRVSLKRGHSARRRQQEGASEYLDGIVEPDVSNIDWDTIEAIDRAVRKLPEVYRAAVVACDLEGLSRKDAAGRLGWTEGTLSGRLSRARKLLADRLRKSRITFSAAGLSTILGTDSSVRAALVEKVMKVVSSDSGISAPISALTQGVVQTMNVYKFKTIAAAILVACTLGFGAWNAGAGDDPGRKDSPVKVPAPPQALGQTLDLSKMRSQLNSIEQELLDLMIESKAAGGNPSESLKRRMKLAEDKLSEFQKLMAEAREQPKPPVANPKLDPALADLQGKWNIETIMDGKKSIQDIFAKSDLVMEISGNSMFMPYRESDGKVKRTEYKIFVDAGKNPKTINLYQPGKPVGAGIYEFAAPGTTCSVCHKNPVGDEKPLPALVPLCSPGVKLATGVKLAIEMNGVRPTKFGGNEGVIEFQMTRVATDPHNMNMLLPPYKTAEKLIESSLLSQEMRRLREAQAFEEVARAKLASAKDLEEAAKEQVKLATKLLEEARARIAALEKIAPPKKQPQLPGKDDAWVTIHVRTQLEGEQMLWLKLSDSPTVLEGLHQVPSESNLKPEGVNVWVVRDKKVLPVDLGSLAQKTDSKTNYQLQHGDRLFVQVKIEK